MQVTLFWGMLLYRLRNPCDDLPLKPYQFSIQPTMVSFPSFSGVSALRWVRGQVQGFTDTLNLTAELVVGFHQIRHFITTIEDGGVITTA